MDSLELVVRNELKILAGFYEKDSARFEQIIAKKAEQNAAQRRKFLENEIIRLTNRNAQLLTLFEKMYEDNISGKISDDWFRQLSEKHSMEQDSNIITINDYEKELEKLKDTVARQKKFTEKVKKFLEMKYINPILLKELIEKIEVYNIEGSGKSKTQRIVIHYKFLGILDVPNEFSGNNVVVEPREGVSVEYLPVQGKIA